MYLRTLAKLFVKTVTGNFLVVIATVAYPEPFSMVGTVLEQLIK